MINQNKKITRLIDMYTQFNEKHEAFAGNLGGKWVAPKICKFYNRFTSLNFLQCIYIWNPVF